MDDYPWVALVGPFPKALRPSTRWRDRYQRVPRTIQTCELEGALADPTLDSVILYWNLPDRLTLAQRVLATNRPLCLPGPLTPDELQLLQTSSSSPFLGAASLVLPAVRAMKLALDPERIRALRATLPSDGLPDPPPRPHTMRR